MLAIVDLQLQSENESRDFEPFAELSPFIFAMSLLRQHGFAETIELSRAYS